MAPRNQQFAFCNTHMAAGIWRHIASDPATASGYCETTGAVHKRPGDDNSSHKKPFNKIVNIRNAIIGLLIMLILLLTLQAPVCCDNIVTSGLMLPPAVHQPLQPAQLAPVISATTVPVTVETAAVTPQADNTGPTKLEPATTRPVKTQLASAGAMISGHALIADVPALEASVIAPAPDTGRTATASIDGITTDAAVTLTAITSAGYIKIAHTGEALDDNVDNWECVEDNSSKLTWEVKKNDGGIRDKDHSYTWFTEIKGESKGISNGGRCKGGVSCDTNSYAHALNKQKLCGYSDWRLPTRAELESLVEYRNNPADATINKSYFPEAIPSWYWTSSENTRREGYAWYVLFRNGVALNDLKERPKHIRLVRGRVQK